MFMIIGSHVSFSGGLLGSVKETLSYHANALMFYTGAPQNSVRKAIDLKNTQKAHELLAQNNIPLNHVICHAPYIINLANKEKPETWDFAVSFLKEEIRRCTTLGVSYLVLHPGSCVKETREKALQNICDGLNEVLDSDTPVMILLETMAGKGTEYGISIQELKAILKGVIYQNKVGICLDTCHLNDSGIDINFFDDYLNEFEKEIGLEKIKCVHLNDSLNPLGSHKDRHANIGYGTIGFNPLLNVCYNPKLKDVPKILETPYIEDKAPYYFEIKSLLEKKFNNHLKEDVLK